MQHASSALRSRGAIGVAVVAVAALAAGCSNSGGSSHRTVAHELTPAAHTIPRKSSADRPAPASAKTPTSDGPSHDSGLDLSGSWSGRYEGGYSGSFHLTLVQHGQRLVGSITLSTTTQRDRLTGKVNGSTITFGTVGSQAITYSGTVSGNTMTGAYQVGGAPTGSWSATRSS